MNQTAKQARPTGITVLAIIAILGGIGGLLGGLAIISGMASEPLLVGIIVAVFAILGFILGAGFLKGISWARPLGLTVYILSIPLGIAEIFFGGFGLIGGGIRVITGLLVIYYLTRRYVKSFFGKASEAVSKTM